MQIKLDPKTLADVIMSSDYLQMQVSKAAMLTAARAIVAPNEVVNEDITNALVDALRNDHSFQNEVGRATARYVKSLRYKSLDELPPKVQTAVETFKRSTRKQIADELINIDFNQIERRVMLRLAEAEKELTAKLEEMTKQMAGRMLSNHMRSKVMTAFEEALKNVD